MDFSTMTMEQVEARLAAIRTELTSENADQDALQEEINGLAQRRAQIIAQAAQRRTLLDSIANISGAAPVNDEQTPQRTYTVESVEYRDAFYASILGTETEEQRSVINAVNGIEQRAITVANDAIAIPKSLDTKIWDNIHTAHPILADISVMATGISLEVTKHTAITAGKAVAVNEATAGTAEANTFVKVVLNGQDYTKHVELSYAQAKMSQGALEDYLAEEISADLGEALAAAVFTRIKSDVGAAAVTVASGSSLTYKNLMEGFGAVARGANLKIYCSRAKKYSEIIGMVDNSKQPVFRDGVAAGAEIKEDSAAGTDIFILDPTRFVLNEVQGLMIESDRDIKSHTIVISGYLRAEGCMRDNGAAAYITFA